MTLLIILSAVLIISIIMAIIGDRHDYDWIYAAGMTFTIFTPLCGFGLAASICTYNSKEIKVEKFSYAKTTSAIIIETPLTTETFTDAKTVNSVNDSSKIYYYVHYNAYGYEISRNIIVK